jgi:hypothetical protein
VNPLHLTTIDKARETFGIKDVRGTDPLSVLVGDAVVSDD